MKHKVYCQVCGTLLLQEHYPDQKLRVYPCNNPNCNSTATNNNTMKGA